MTNQVYLKQFADASRTVRNALHGSIPTSPSVTSQLTCTHEEQTVRVFEKFTPSSSDDINLRSVTGTFRQGNLTEVTVEDFSPTWAPVAQKTTTFSPHSGLLEVELSDEATE